MSNVNLNESTSSSSEPLSHSEKSTFSSSYSIASTLPVTSSEECTSQEETSAWGLLFPFKPCYTTFELTGDKKISFGRHPKCSYIFIDGVVTDYFLHISKKHFIIYKEYDSRSEIGYIVYLEDHSFCGTYINKDLVGKEKKRVLSSGDIISLAIPNNRIFFYYDIALEKENLPKAFSIKYIINSFVILGEGGYGVVKQATNKKTQEIVAVKILKSCGSNKDLAYEGTIINSIKHPGIVEVKDIYDNDKIVIIVMEYVAGGDLLAYILDQGPIPELKCKSLFLKLLEALQHLHDNNIVHRDIKPENILLTSKDLNNCILKITDFGLSRFVSDQSYMHTAVGTINYCAPELLNNIYSGYTSAVDIWSIGCVLYIMLCAKPPFQKNANQTIDYQIMKGIYDLSDGIWKNISDDGKDLVKRMLTVNSKNRISLKDSICHPWFQKSNKPPLKKVKFTT